MGGTTSKDTSGDTNTSVDQTDATVESGLHILEIHGGTVGFIATAAVALLICGGLAYYCSGRCSPCIHGPDAGCNHPRYDEVPSTELRAMRHAHDAGPGGSWIGGTPT